MANNDYRPDDNCLASLGFVETNDGSDHPYGIEHKLDLGEETYLVCDAFRDFSIEIKGNWNIAITFTNKDDLELFIERFKIKQ